LKGEEIIDDEVCNRQSINTTEDLKRILKEKGIEL